MTFSDWSALAEIVSALGVIVTLLYLAKEVRDLRKRTLFDSLQNVRKEFLDLFDRTTSTPEIADIFARGLNDMKSLSKAEMGCFHSHLHAMHHGFGSVWNLYNAGQLAEAEMVGVRNIFLSYLLTPGGREWWDSIKPIPPPYYIRYIGDALLEAAGKVKPANQDFPWFQLRENP